MKSVTKGEGLRMRPKEEVPIGKSRGDAVYDAIVQEPGKYGLIIKPTGKASQTIIGSAESVEKYFSTLKEKEAAAMRGTPDIEILTGRVQIMILILPFARTTFVMI